METIEYQIKKKTLIQQQHNIILTKQLKRICPGFEHKDSILS